VTPFGAINDPHGRVTVVLDSDLMAHELVNAHPLVNTQTTTLASQDLIKFLEATGHLPRITAVAAKCRPSPIDNVIAFPPPVTHLIG
jgi:Uncharacterized conserved protein